jgi:hypothetical protein
MIQIPLLSEQDIDVKVKQVGDGYAYLLLYKSARVDMRILDEVFGADRWESDYKVVNDNLYAGIGIWFDNRQIWKWDCGIESKSDGGNEKKGEASDAFKRAGFKWGIGRELYTAPLIKIEATTIPMDKEGKKFKLKYSPKLAVSHIAYNEDREITELVILDGIKEVFTYPSKKDKAQNRQDLTFNDVSKANNVETIKQALKGTNWTIDQAEQVSIKSFGRYINELNVQQLKSLILRIEEAKKNG